MYFFYQILALHSWIFYPTKFKLVWIHRYKLQLPCSNTSDQVWIKEEMFKETTRTTILLSDSYHQIIRSWQFLFKYLCILHLTFTSCVQQRSLRVIVFPKCLTEIKLYPVYSILLFYHSLTISKMEMSLVWHNS
jgi:hypothetical protein